MATRLVRGRWQAPDPDLRLITQKVALMPLAKVTDVSYNRSPPGRLLGYGIFVMESAGQDEALHRVRWVPDPDHTYRAICVEILGVDDHERVFDQEERPSATSTCGVCRAGRSRVAAGHPRRRANPLLAPQELTRTRPASRVALPLDPCLYFIWMTFSRTSCSGTRPRVESDSSGSTARADRARAHSPHGSLPGATPR